jgi:hypothetical protein
MELDHIWGVWEEEKEPIDAHRKWIRQPSQSGNDMRHHLEVHRFFFLDEKIPRHELGQGYVRVVEQSIMWKETETSKIFTYQG